MNKGCILASYQDWHIPYHEDVLSLQTALASLLEVAPTNPAQPLMLQWLDGLQGNNQGFQKCQTKLDRQQHDCIHIVLGRGLLDTDEVFTTGFALASACKGTMTEQSLNALISRSLHQQLASLNERELAVFRDAVKLAYISGCVGLERFDFSEWLDQPLRVLRDAIGLEHELLTAYYAVEQRRYPHNKASQRLVPASKQVVAF